MKTTQNLINISKYTTLLITGGITTIYLTNFNGSILGHVNTTINAEE